MRPDARLLLPVLLPALASAATVYEEVTATHLPVGSIGGRSMDARPADLDDDGDLDIVVATEFGRNLILINDGAGHFTDESAARIPQPVHDSEDTGIDDLDGDGDLDILFVSEDDQTNELYLNDGSGHFTDATDRLGTTGTSNAVLVADVDDDGDPDVVIGNAGQNVVLINDGTAHFTNETAARLPASVAITQDLEWGDVDGDGDADLVEGNENGNRLLLNDGAGVFTDVTATHLPLPPAGEETREADLGDVDGDGDLDVFLASVTFGQGRPSQNRLLLNDGDGTFTDVTATHLPTEARNTVDGDLVDLDGDGDLDIPTAQAFDGTYQILLNDGDGHYTDATATMFDPIPTGDGIDVEAADFTGDGRLDLYLTGYARDDYLYRGADTTVTVPGDEGAVHPRSHPNPFRASTRIAFSLPDAAPVTLEVVDVNGRQVATLVDASLPAGAHEVTWQPTNAAPGVYFYRLFSSAGSRGGELLLLR